MKLSYKNIAALELNTALAAAQGETTSRGQAQALAWIAHTVRNQRHVASTALAAVEAAAKEDDPYGAVFVLAWPIRALLERGEPKIARRILAEAIAKSAHVSPAASQSEALFLLMQGAMFGPDRDWEPAFRALLAASLPVVNWRQSRNVRDAICMVASFDFALAKLTAENLSDEKLKTTVVQLLRDNKKQLPRPFFW